MICDGFSERNRKILERELCVAHFNAVLQRQKEIKDWNYYRDRLLNTGGNKEQTVDDMIMMARTISGD